MLEVLKEYLDPSKVILFGSRARAGAPFSSDFDFAVEPGPAEDAAKIEINRKIEEISGLYKVDVVYLNEVDADFRDIILKTGKVIYERRA